MNSSEGIKIISPRKLLCGNSSYYLFSSGPKLYGKAIASGHDCYLGTFPLAAKYRLFGNIRLMQRLLRLEPRYGMFVDEGTAIVSFHGAIYRVDLKKRSLCPEHYFRNGMNNPLSFCKVETLHGFRDGILYGEYFGNAKKEAVRIFHRNEEGEWKCVFSFPVGTITHIHKIFPHKFRNSLIVFTGDLDDESAIWEITENFKKVRKIVGGRQIYRSCVGYPWENGIVYATDTPLEQNAIYWLDLQSEEPRVKKCMQIAGPAIYGVFRHDKLWLSTSVEPDSSIRPYWRYAISRKRGLGVLDWYSHIYCGNLQIGFREIVRLKKDWLPMLLFGFGTVQFADMHNKVMGSGQSLCNCDGNTLFFSE